MTARSDAYDRRQREAGEMTMVERVAKAIFDAWEDKIGKLVGSWDRLPEAQKDLARYQARAAIEAMLKPSDDVVSVLAGYFPEAGAKGAWEVAESQWRECIAAALAEHDADSRENAGR